MYLQPEGLQHPRRLTTVNSTKTRNPFHVILKELNLL